MLVGSNVDSVFGRYSSVKGDVSNSLRQVECKAHVSYCVLVSEVFMRILARRRYYLRYGGGVLPTNGKYVYFDSF